MADVNAPAAPAAPAAPSAPAPAPAAPVPAAPAAPAQQGPRDNETGSQYLQRQFAEKAAAEKDKPAAAPAAPAAEPKPGEEVPAVEKPAEDKPADDKDAKQPDAAAEEETPFEIEPQAPLPPTKLTELVKNAPPEVQAWLDANPDAKNSLYANARLASKVAKYEQHFESPEEAGDAVQDAKMYAELVQGFTGATGLPETRTLLGKIMELSYLRDDDGNVMVDPDSKAPLADGSVGRFMDNVLGLALDYYGGRAKNLNNEDLAAAVDTLKAVREGRGTGSADQEDLTETQKAEAQRLKTEREDLDRTKTAENNRKYDEFERGVAVDTDKEVDKFLGSILDKTDLSDFNRKYVQDQIKEKVWAAVKDNPRFITQRDRLGQRAMGAKTRQERIALAMKYAKPTVEKLAREEFRRAGIRLKSQGDARKAASDAREAASRSEQKGAGQPAAPATLPKAGDLEEQVRQEYAKANNGREPSSAQILQGVMERKRKR